MAPLRTSAPLTLALTLGASAASAAPSPLTLGLGPCLEQRSEEIRRILAIELGREVQLMQSPELQVDCVDEGQSLLLRRTNEASGARIELVALDSRVVARVVALGLADLVERTPPTSESPAPPAAPPAAVRASPSLVRLDSGKLVVSRTAARELSLALSTRLWRATSGYTLGPSLAGRWAPWAGSYLHAGVMVESGSFARELGEVQAKSVSLVLAAGARFRRGGWQSEAGLGWRSGWVRLAGVVDDPTRYRGSPLTGFWAGPSLELRLARRGLLPVQPWLGLELGTALLAPRGRVEQLTVPEFRGIWLSASLGLLLD